MKKILVGVGALIGLAAIFFTALPTLLHAAGLHPVYEGASVDLPGKRALIITTSHSVLAAPGETEGPETGVMASEFTHPYYSFMDAGMELIWPVFRAVSFLLIHRPCPILWPHQKINAI